MMSRSRKRSEGRLSDDLPAYQPQKGKARPDSIEVMKTAPTSIDVAHNLKASFASRGLPTPISCRSITKLRPAIRNRATEIVPIHGSRSRSDRTTDCTGDLYGSRSWGPSESIIYRKLCGSPSSVGSFVGFIKLPFKSVDTLVQCPVLKLKHFEFPAGSLAMNTDAMPASAPSRNVAVASIAVFIGTVCRCQPIAGIFISCTPSSGPSRRGRAWHHAPVAPAGKEDLSARIRRVPFVPATEQDNPACRQAPGATARLAQRESHVGKRHIDG